MRLLMFFCLLLPFSFGEQLAFTNIDNNRLLPSVVEELMKTERATDPITVIFNAYADNFLQSVSEEIISEHLDPLRMPDFHESFEYKQPFITHHGKLDLTKGTLMGLSTLQRDDDVLGTFNQYEQLAIRGPLGFKDLKFDYKYEAKIMGMRFSGNVEGTVKNITFDTTLMWDIPRSKLYMLYFESLDSGYIDDLKFHGNFGCLLGNMLADPVTSILKNELLDTVKNVIKGVLESMVDDINSTVPTEAPPPALKMAPIENHKRMFFKKLLP